MEQRRKEKLKERGRMERERIEGERDKERWKYETKRDGKERAKWMKK
jgi:hypothetical protein